MKYIKKYLCLTLLLSYFNLFSESCSVGCCTDNCDNVKTILLPLMQHGSNLYTQYHKPLYVDSCQWAFSTSLTYQYAQTFRGCETISPILFGDNTLNFMGTDINPNNGSALIADYFGLSKDSDISISFDPKIKNHILDIQCAAGTDKFYFQINLPIIRSTWSLGKCLTVKGENKTTPLQTEIEKILTIQSTVTTPKMIAEAPTPPNPESATNQNFNSFVEDFDGISFPTIPSIATNSQQGIEKEAYDETLEFAYMKTPSPSSFDSKPILKEKIKDNGFVSSTITEDISQDSVDSSPDIKTALAGYVFGDLNQRLYNKFNIDSDPCLEKYKLADIHIIIGYDFSKKEYHHLGAYLKAIFPTGTKIDQNYATYVFQPLVGNGRHLEIGGGLSGHLTFWNCDNRKLNINVDGYITHMFKTSSFRTFDLKDKPISRYALMKEIEQEDDQFDYTGNLFIAGDLNSKCLNILGDMKGEAIVDVIYSDCNWQLGIGYAFFGKTKENFECLKPDKFNNPNIKYGLKGIHGTSLLTISNTLENGTGKVVKAYDETSTSNITTQDFLDEYEPTTLTIEPNNFIDTGDMYTWDDNAHDIDAAADNNPEDLYSLPFPNRSGLMDGQVLNKLFSHIDYVWEDNCWTPMIGIIGSISFTPNNHKTIKFWDIGARIGCSF